MGLQVTLLRSCSNGSLLALLEYTITNTKGIQDKTVQKRTVQPLHHLRPIASGSETNMI
jgi:hypothetical protein